MDVKLRAGTPQDGAAAGMICHEAFRDIAEAHNFPPDVPTPEMGQGLVGTLLAHPGFYSVVAELEGDVVGSNFLDERSVIAGVGPITVAPKFQNGQIGRALMEDVMLRAAERQAPGVRLLQAAYHSRSLALYAKLGFEPRETLACMQGAPIGGSVDGYQVRAAGGDDLADCNAVCQAVHGHDRGGELADAINQGAARVVEHAGRITGYATGIAFFAHAVGESNEHIKALLGEAATIDGSGVLVPIRNAAIFGWCLSHGLRVVQLMTLMTVGLYNDPAGAWLPSVLY